MTNIGPAPIEPDDGEKDIKGLLAAAKCQKRWVQEIRFYEKKAEAWESKGKKILRRYKDDRSSREQKTPRFNILWSNVQTLQPALIAKNPKPDIERRYRDKDVLGRTSSMVLERAISYFVNQSFLDATKQAVIDRLLPGRGTVWARYEPHFQDAEYNENEEVADEGEEITDNVEKYAQDTYEVKSGEDICWDYVHWQDFGHTFGRTWDEVDSGWRKVYLTREELIERFGKEIGKAINLDYSPHDLKDNKEEEIEKKATIYEIWCKPEKKVYWVHKDYLSGPLDEKDDPLGLQDFWPFPKPLFSTLANDTCIPVSDYQEYQDQANELDELTSRIGAITRAVKVAGVYDASAEGIERIFAEGVENQLVPVKQWAVMSEKGGISNAYALLPMQEILQTLLGLYEARDKVKQDLYEITGISDIVRGASDPSETYGAQRIKSQFGTLRLSQSQDDVQRFCRDLICIGTQIIANHFSLDTIKKISGVQLLSQQEKMLVQMSQAPQMGHNGGSSMQPQQPQPMPPQLASLDPEDLQEMMEEPTWEEVYELLKDELMLSYKIDIETDSTIKFDQQQDQQARVQFLSAAGGFLQQAMQVQNPDLAPLMAKMLMFGVRGFPIGKELESAFENAIHKLEKDAQDPSKQKPNPEMAKIQGEQQIAQQKLQSDEKLRQLEMQSDASLLQMKAQSEDKRLALQQQVEASNDARDAENDMAKAKLDAETKITVANIQAKTQLQAASISKTNSEDGGTTLDENGNPVKQPSASDMMSQLLQTVTQQLQQTLVGNAQTISQSHAALAQAITKPKQVIRGPDGSITGVQ